MDRSADRGLIKRLNRGIILARDSREDLQKRIFFDDNPIITRKARARDSGRRGAPLVRGQGMDLSHVRGVFARCAPDCVSIRHCIRATSARGERCADPGELADVDVGISCVQRGGRVGGADRPEASQQRDSVHSRRLRRRCGDDGPGASRHDARNRAGPAFRTRSGAGGRRGGVRADRVRSRTRA